MQFIIGLVIGLAVGYFAVPALVRWYKARKDEEPDGSE